MRRLRLPAILIAVSALTAAGVGNSSNHASGLVQMMDFEEENETLLGYPDRQPPLGWFKRVANTAHLPASVPVGTPPNPILPAACSGQFRAWNNVIKRTPEGPGRANALLSIIIHMAQHQCCAEIVRDTDSDPQTIISIRPTTCGPD